MAKTALITGCSSGYGRAAAELFLEQGWNVVATMRKPNPDVFGKGSDRLRVIAMDVTDEASISRGVNDGIAAFGTLDVLVNNAGIGHFGPFEAVAAATVRELFETNTFGLMAVAQAVIPHMRERGAGTIVNVSSSVCFAGMPLVSVYAASKFAVEGFSESLAFEMSSVGVRVKLVEPGYGPGTSFQVNSADRMGGAVPPAYQAYAGQLLEVMRNPGLVTTARQVAEGIFAAATDETERLRFPAGPDSEQLAQARWHGSDEEFRAGIRERFRLKPR